MRTKANFMMPALMAFLFISCSGQVKHNPAVLQNPGNKGVVGGPFENGDFMYIGMPGKISSVDTSAGWMQEGQKLLITGTIYQLDGKTPAPGVILYYYHTDVNGLYANKQGLNPRVVRHGYIRGWVQSDPNGKYAIYTVRPAPYPNRNFEAHIHPTIKEPGINEYYIDEFVFDDDRLLTGAKRKRLPNRGGSGILRLLKKGNLHIAEHDIILGLNIPNYPATVKTGKQSGLHIGEDQPSFRPSHAYGPDKGSRACPVCKYGRYQGVVYFVGNKPDWADVKKWLVFLDQQNTARGKYLKAYFVYGNEKGYDENKRRKELENLGVELQLKSMALTFVPSFDDAESEANLNKLNPSVSNTFIIYRNRTIINKFIDLAPTGENFKRVTKSLDEMKGDYFDLEPAQGHDN